MPIKLCCIILVQWMIPITAHFLIFDLSALMTLADNPIMMPYLFCTFRIKWFMYVYHCSLKLCGEFVSINVTKPTHLLCLDQPCNKCHYLLSYDYLSFMIVARCHLYWCIDWIWLQCLCLHLSCWFYWSNKVHEASHALSWENFIFKSLCQLTYSPLLI